MWRICSRTSTSARAGAHPDGGVPRETLRSIAPRTSASSSRWDRLPDAGNRKSGTSASTSRAHRRRATRLVTLDTVTRKDASADFFGEDNVRGKRSRWAWPASSRRGDALIATGSTRRHRGARRGGRGVQDVRPRSCSATPMHRLPRSRGGRRADAHQDAWVLGPVEWTPELTERRCLVAERTGKAILKLTRATTRASPEPLLSKHARRTHQRRDLQSPAGQDSGRRKLPSRKSVIVFSPHPDDDVISMGGCCASCGRTRTRSSWPT